LKIRGGLKKIDIFFANFEKDSPIVERVRPKYFTLIYFDLNHRKLVWIRILETCRFHLDSKSLIQSNCFVTFVTFFQTVFNFEKYPSLQKLDIFFANLEKDGLVNLL